jgi:hypothetical protein
VSPLPTTVVLTAGSTSDLSGGITTHNNGGTPSGGTSAIATVLLPWAARPLLAIQSVLLAAARGMFLRQGYTVLVLPARFVRISHSPASFVT